MIEKDIIDNESIDNDNEERVRDSINFSNIRSVSKRKKCSSSLFPPPSVPFLPHGADSTFLDDIGIFAYVSDLPIVLVQLSFKDNTDGSSWPKFSLLDGSGWERYQSISFCKERIENWPIADCPLVSTSESGIVKIWNIVECSTIKFHLVHEGNKTISQWSPHNPNLIISMDTLGQLSVWDLGNKRPNSSSVFIIQFEPFEINCMSVNPAEELIIAIGDKSGWIHVIDAKGTGSVLHKLNLPNFDWAFNLSWKPYGSWAPVPTGVRKYREPYLVSSSATTSTPYIYVWDRDGKEISTMSPFPKDYLVSQAYKPWVKNLPLAWASSQNDEGNNLFLITVSNDGTLVKWSSKENQLSIVHEENYGQNVYGLLVANKMLWTFSAEPNLICWNLDQNKLVASIPTFSGICSLSVNYFGTIDNTLVAFGGRDPYIRIQKFGLNYPEIGSAVVQVPTTSPLISSKVTALAWHPYKECIGFGTEGGTIGIYVCRNDSKFIMEFSKTISGTIYSVDWGPKCFTKEFESLWAQRREEKGESQIEEAESANKKSQPYYCLYACGSKKVYTINLGNKDNGLFDATKIVEQSNVGRNKGSGRIFNGASDIRWSPDFAYFAIGYQDGKIELYAPPYLKLRCWIKCHTSAIQFMSWRTSDFFNESNAKISARFLATASNDGTAKVCNLSELYSPQFLSDENSPIVEILSSSLQLNAHLGIRVIQVAWSPHNDNLLCTVSYDHTAVVWNIESNTRIARYINHEHRLIACIFHPSHPFKLITCSDECTVDACVHVWDFREHPEHENYFQMRQSQSMCGEKVEALRAVAAPKAKVIFRPTFEAEASQITSKPNYLDRDESCEIINVLTAEKQVIGKIHESTSLFPIENQRTPKNTLADELKFIVDQEPLPFMVDIDEFKKKQIEEERTVPKTESEIDLLINTLEAMRICSSDLESTKDKCDISPIFTSSFGTILKSEMEGHLKRKNFILAATLLNYITEGPELEFYLSRMLELGYFDQTLIMLAKKCSKKFQQTFNERCRIHLASSKSALDAALYSDTLCSSYQECYDVLFENNYSLEASLYAALNRGIIEERLYGGNDENRFVQMKDELCKLTNLLDSAKGLVESAF